MNARHRFTPSPENEFCGWCAEPEWAPCHTPSAYDPYDNDGEPFPEDLAPVVEWWIP